MEPIVDFVQQNQTAVAIVVGVVVLLLLAWLVARAMRHRGGQRTVERPTGTVRRPVYTDPALLADLRANAARGLPSGTTPAGDPADDEPLPATSDVRPVDDTATTSQDVDPGRDPARSPAGTDGDAGRDDARRVDEVIAALQRTDVLIDLDADPGAELVAGKAVVLTGTLERHPASDAAEILELSAPLLHRGANGGGSVTNGGAEGATADGAPLVVRLDHPIDSRDYLMVLPREHLVVDDPTRLGSRVSVLAVIERPLGKRDRVEVEDYLRPHLSRDGQQVLRDRDLGETIATLSQVAHEDLGADDLPFRGPGALLTPAAIQR